MHHIERRNPARTGDPVAIEHEARLPRRQMVEGFSQHGGVFPVNGEVAIVEQACPRQNIGAAGNAADPDTLPCKTAQKRK